MTTRVPKELRDQVRQRASGRCEYCCKPEGYSLYSHHVDHIIPLLHGGDLSLDNLAWACFQCNTTKSANIASYDLETGELTPLFHPHKQKWDDHFEMVNAVINGKTPIGRVTVKILQINHPDQVETRQKLIKAKIW